MKKVLCAMALVIGIMAPQMASAALVNFDEVILASLTPLDGTTYYDPYGISFTDETQYAVDSRFAEDDYGITSTNGSNNLVSVLFADAISALEFGWLTIGGNSLYASAYDAANNLVDSWSATGLSGDSTGTGSLSGLGITKVTWNDGTGAIGIDSLNFRTAVPEPSTLLLLGSGLLGLGYFRRKLRG